MRSTALRLPAASLSILLATLIVAACALNPIAIAETPEQKYNAAILTYDALLEPAVEIVEDATAPADLRRALQAAVVQSGAIYEQAKQAYQEFLAAKSAVANAPAGAPRLDVATANLETWVLQLEGMAGRLATLMD